MTANPVRSPALFRAFRLRAPESALDAIATLPEPLDGAARDGLIELVLRPGAIRTRVAALVRLRSASLVPWPDLLDACLADDSVALRLAALDAAGHVAQVEWLTHDRLRRDPCWQVRAKALELLARSPEQMSRLLTAADDPHWRVRQSLIESLESQDGAVQREETLMLLAQLETASPHTQRVRGVADFLRFLWDRQPTPPQPARANDGTLQCPIWDWDDAVLARRLAEMDECRRREHLGAMPRLLAHDEPRVHGPASETLRRYASAVDLLRCLMLWDDPRHEAAGRVRRLLSRVDLDRLETLVRLILERDEPSPAIDGIYAAISSILPWREFPGSLAAAWLARGRDCRGIEAEHAWLAAHLQLEQTLGTVDLDRVINLLSSPHPQVRALALELAARPEHDLTPPALFASDPHALVRQTAARFLGRLPSPTNAVAEAARERLAADSHPYVRAAALTPARAAALLENPDAEASWHVLAEAARLCQRPLWELIPREVSPVPMYAVPVAPDPPVVQIGTPPLSRFLGPERIEVSPLALSGHYGLPEEGFARAVGAGVNLLFWEPNYGTLTHFARKIPSSQRRQLHFMAGTFEAEPERIERDVDRALRNLRLDSLAVFIVFWVRSVERAGDETYQVLTRLKQSGKIRMGGLSTHDRALAAKALADGWNPLMVRHSAAHTKAEQEIFPRALKQGASVITFSNTCYGRLAKAITADGLNAADCYRYSLLQRGVTTCLTAPATIEQLQENLQVLVTPTLSPEKVEILRRRGAELHARESAFRRLVHAQ